MIRDNQPTHVLVEIDQYERLMRIAEARELDAMMENPETEFIDARDAAMMIAGSWVKKARVKAGLTQQQLARRVGVPQSQISRIERNPDRTTVRTMKRIAAALKVDIGTLAKFAAR